MTILPDMNELADRLFGTRRAETTKVSSNSETITLYGVATSDSEDGMVSVDMTDAVYLVDDENELIENDASTSIQMPTHVDVREGDEVAITLVGNSTAKAPVVSGVVGGGDRQQAEIDAAADAASAASDAASAAQQKADKAAQDIAQAEQEIADFKSNTYTKEQVNKKVDEGPDSLKSWITANYTNSQDLGTTYATKTLVSQTKEEIELSASQQYATKGIGNPNLSPFYAHDLSDVYDATDNPDGYWTETPARATQLDDGWAHIVLDNSSGTSTMYSRTYIRPMAEVPDNATLLIEIRNLDTDVTSTTTDPRLWFNANASNSQMWRNVVYFTEDGTYRFPLVKTSNASPTHFARWWWGISRGARAEFDVRISVYANAEATIDDQQVTLPYEGSFKPYVTDQGSLAKTYATNSALTVGLDGIRTEVSGTYATKGAGNPNLSPITAHDTQDRYNASTNPDGYWWANITQYENIDDGWVHVVRNASTSTQWAQQFQTVLLENLKPSTKYTLLMEYRNVEVEGTLAAWPLYASSDQFAYPPETTAFTVDSDMVVRAQLMTKDSFEGIATGVDVRHRLVPPSGGSGSCSYDLRLSLYENASGAEGENLPYGGAYKPYVTDQESLSKTYTKSSTFTQTINGLDGRITATEDGITLLDTLIRLFQGGVLAGYVGNAVSALMNAAGSFDVVQTTWADGEPTIADTLASFGASLVEIGKNSANAVIDFCAGGVRMAYDSVRAGFTILSSMRIYLLSEGNSTTNATLEATSVDEDTSVSRTASINAHASTGAGSQQIMLEVYEGNGATEYQSVALQSTGFKINSGTPIKGIYFGTKVAAPGNVTKFCVFTAAECATQFGRQLNAGKDFAILMNGDGAAYNGMMTASIQAGALYAQFPSARNANTRFNYLVILGA